MRAWKFVLALVLPGLMVSSIASAAPSSEILAFTVLRNGDPVGTHTIAVHPNGDGAAVSIATEVVVKVAMIPVYRFEHHSEESWSGDHLISLSSQTNDDGTQHAVNVAEANGSLRGTADGKAVQVADPIIPASLWEPRVVAQTALLNTLDGHAMTVHSADAGVDTVTVRGKPVSAHHYQMTGDLARDLWYDTDGHLVQVQFKAKDDSVIRYVLAR